MNAAVLAPVRARASVFDLEAGDAWPRWRERKLAARAIRAEDLMVEVRDPLRLTPFERAALVERCRRTNMAIYASRAPDAGPDLALRLGAQLGLVTPDVPPLAAPDGVARIAFDAARARAGFIPYTSRRMRWHTDGCGNGPQAPVRSLVLHCVRPASTGGETALLDPELAWLLLRDAGEELVQALMDPAALTVARGGARPAITGPVFAVEAGTGDLRMRYTARRRSARWRCDATTSEAAARLLALMDRDRSCGVRVRLEAGMGIVCNNVLHQRAAFEDAGGEPRLLLRARFRERIAGTRGAWAGFT